MRKEKLIVIVGPTAVGKTAMSLALAKSFKGEIINGDALQVYQELSIGTAKITKAEMKGIPHHLIDFLPPTESYSVARFQEDARKKIDEITNRKNIPILVGGTGLYVKAATHNYQFTDEQSDSGFREALEAQLKKSTPEDLHNQLKALNPESAARIHPNNTRRVIRALEIIHLDGISREANQEDEPLYDMAFVGLTMKRELLYERINARVDLMIEKGLVTEARSLYDRGIRGTTAVQAIGYKELYLYFDGECSLEEAIALIKRNSRRFAKRQFTWFNNKMEITWFDMTDVDPLQKAQEIMNFVAGKLSLK